MSLLNPSKGWRSSSSRLLALYSSLFVAWSSILMGVLYYEVSGYLSDLSRHSLMQRQHLFSHFRGEQLEEALAASMTFDIRGIDAYGLFDSQHRYLSGALNHIPHGLPLDGKIHMLSDCAGSDDPTLPNDSCDAVATQTRDGLWLVLVRDNGSLFAVTRIILHALFWGVTLTILPGIVGWHLLRRRPLRRIRAIQASAEAIVAGDLTRRLPLSNRRDELDMLAAIVNAMLERIERLASEAQRAFTLGRQPLLLVNPNASELLVQRRWAPESFSALIVALQKKWPDCLILITGSPAEHAYVENVRLGAKVANALNFAGQVSFTELPALYTLADVMVTNDSGPGHFSSVTGLHTVVLFGPETPALYGSLGKSIPITAQLACSPCVSAANHRKTPCSDNACMRAISVDQVLEKMAIQFAAARSNA